VGYRFSALLVLVSGGRKLVYLFALELTGIFK
jgi:hypothetical protein